jgi:hypothetical protein
MNRRVLTLALGATAGLLLLSSAVVFACQCVSHESEKRYFVATSVTRLDGGGGDAPEELARWSGTARLTVSTGGTQAVHLWIKDEISDEQLRNVRIDAVASDTADSGLADGGGQP